MLQPYHRGIGRLDPLREALADIDTLNSIDKHRDLHVILALPYAIPDMDVPPEYGFRRHPEFGVPVKSNGLIDRWTFTRPPPTNEVGISHVLLTVGVLQDGQRFEILANLGGCILAVWEIIQRFANRFPALVDPPDLSWIRRSAKIT